jgi:hypothetical protein
MCDKDYFLKIMPLVSLFIFVDDVTDAVKQLCAQICHFQSEVKECCNAHCMATLVAMGSVPNIMAYVMDQLSQYTYMFRQGPKVAVSIGIWSDALQCGCNGLIMCSKPYQNDQIIKVIQDLHFTGGLVSFVNCFKSQIPTY